MKQLFILIDVINRLSSRYVSRFATCFRSLKCLTVGLALLSFAPNLYAHPHSWIEMKTHIEGENGMITGPPMEWSFDAMTSMYMLDGEEVSADTEAESESHHHTRNRHSCANFCAFTDGTSFINISPFSDNRRY